MDFKVLIATFGAVFLAELADKTQLVSITMSAKTARPFIVFLGSVLAYMVITLVSVILGAAASKYIKPDVIKLVAGGLFVIIGLLMLWGKV